MTTLFLIRHGEADGNAYRFFQGQYDSLLTPRGHEQLTELAARMSGIPLDAVYASDLYRARTTAYAIASPRGLPVILRPGLREMHFGILEGRAFGEIKRSWPRYLDESPDYTPPEGGEDRLTVGTRMEAAIRAIVRENEGKCVAAVSHGVAIRTYLCRATGDDEYSKLRLGNTARVTLEFDTADSVPRVKIYDEAAASVPRVGVRPPDLWFSRALLQSDAQELRAAGYDSWMAVYGSTNSFNIDTFMENTAAMIKASPDAAFFAMIGEERAGVLLLDTRQPDEPKAGHIALVYLKPDYRGIGLGAQLLGQAILVYRAHGRRVLRLNVARRNKYAQKLYKKHGFTPCHPILSHLASQISMRRDIYVPAVSECIGSGCNYIY